MYFTSTSFTTNISISLLKSELRSLLAGAKLKIVTILCFLASFNEWSAVFSLTTILATKTFDFFIESSALFISVSFKSRVAPKFTVMKLLPFKKIVKNVLLLYFTYILLYLPFLSTNIDATDVGNLSVNVTFSVLILSLLRVSIKLLPNKSFPSYVK